MNDLIDRFFNLKEGYAIFIPHIDGNALPTPEFKNSHVYIVTDETINNDDWVIVTIDGKHELHQTSYKDAIGWCMVGDYKFDQTAQYHKVVATTDKLPLEPYMGHYDGIDVTNYIPQILPESIEMIICNYPHNSSIFVGGIISKANNEFAEIFLIKNYFDYESLIKNIMYSVSEIAAKLGHASTSEEMKIWNDETKKWMKENIFN